MMEMRHGKETHRATRADVAQLAHVSTAVVSYVFNNGPRNVAPETAAKVRAAAKKLNYRPNSMARALRTGSSKTLGIIVPDLSNPFFSDVYNALETNAAQEGYSTLFMASHQDPNKELDRVSRLIARDVDAIIIRSDKITAEVIEAAKNLKIVVHGSDPSHSRSQMRIHGFPGRGATGRAPPYGTWTSQYRHAYR